MSTHQPSKVEDARPAWRWLDDATLAATTRATYTVYVRKLERSTSKSSRTS
jgi:hypothetical protein